MTRLQGDPTVLHPAAAQLGGNDTNANAIAIARIERSVEPTVSVASIMVFPFLRVLETAYAHS